MSFGSFIPSGLILGTKEYASVKPFSLRQFLGRRQRFEIEEVLLDSFRWGCEKGEGTFESLFVFQYNGTAFPKTLFIR